MAGISTLDRKNSSSSLIMLRVMRTRKKRVAFSGYYIFSWSFIVFSVLRNLSITFLANSGRLNSITYSLWWPPLPVASSHVRRSSSTRRLRNMMTLALLIEFPGSWPHLEPSLIQVQTMPLPVGFFTLKRWFIIASSYSLITSSSTVSSVSSFIGTLRLTFRRIY